MKILVIKEKINSPGQPIEHGQALKIDCDKLEGTSTKSIYIRKGFMNGTLFLSKKGHGAGGAGDIWNLSNDGEIEVNSNLFNRILTFAKKANALVD